MTRPPQPQADGCCLGLCPPCCSRLLDCATAHLPCCVIADIPHPGRRYNDMIMARLFAHEDILELAQYSSRWAQGSTGGLRAVQQQVGSG